MAIARRQEAEAAEDAPPADGVRALEARDQVVEPPRRARQQLPLLEEVQHAHRERREEGPVAEHGQEQVDRQVEAAEHRVRALGRRRQVGDEDEREGEGVREETGGVDSRGDVDHQEDEDDRPGEEGGPVAQAHRREVPGLGPPLGQGRGVEGEAKERRGQADRREDAATEDRVEECVQRPDGVEDESEQQIGAGVHSAPKKQSSTSAYLSRQAPLRQTIRRTRALPPVTRTAAWPASPAR